MQDEALREEYETAINMGSIKISMVCFFDDSFFSTLVFDNSELLKMFLSRNGSLDLRLLQYGMGTGHGFNFYSEYLAGLVEHLFVFNYGCVAVPMVMSVIGMGTASGTYDSSLWVSNSGGSSNLIEPVQRLYSSVSSWM